MLTNHYFIHLLAIDCPSGTSVFEGSCYRYMSTPEDYSTAKSECADFYSVANVVSIESEDENNYVKSLYELGNVYISLNNEFKSYLN